MFSRLLVSRSTHKRLFSLFVALSLVQVSWSLDLTTTSASCDNVAMAEFKSRKIGVKLLSKEQSEGMNARVRRSIGRPELRNFDPFLMLDEFAGDGDAGFPDHPHRGFETVSYLLEGSFFHEDSQGHSGKLEVGDLQWMTAGRGIMHSEIPGAERTRGMQLWVNLRSKDKMMAPRYQELKKADIPVATQDGVKAIVIAGEAFGVASPVKTLTPTVYLHFVMEPNSVFQQPIDPSYNAFLYTLEGEMRVPGEAALIPAHYTVTLSKASDGETGVRVEAGPQGCSVLLLAGQPIGEPVVQYGPFVMNTDAEIQQTFVDFQQGRNGFEGARGWESVQGKAFKERLRKKGYGKYVDDEDDD